MVQWLRPCLPIRECGFNPWLGSKDPIYLVDKKTKHVTSNIITNSLKTFKMVHIKKKLKKVE